MELAENYEIENCGCLGAQGFKWQSTREVDALKDKPFKEWLRARPVALRPIYWEISSDAYTRFKTQYETDIGQQIFGVHRYKE